MNLRDYLDKLPRGGASGLALGLGISTVYLSQLAARQDQREPSPELCVRFEDATAGAVTRRDLRPDDWHRIWPELVNKDHPAPSKPAPEAAREVANREAA